MRPFGMTAFWLSLAALIGALMIGGSARAGLRFQEGTPAAGTPAATTPATTEVVTLVAWYANDPSGEFLNVLPLATDQGTVAGPASGAGPIGRAEFPDDDFVTITIGDSRFESYLRYEGDENLGRRWVWFDDAPEARPATLVLQVAGTEGTYVNYFGTATFVSREEGAGGVLILALRPPTPGEEGAATEPAADEGAATEPAADAAATEPAADDAAPAAETPAAGAATAEAPAEDLPTVVVATEEPAT